MMFKKLFSLAFMIGLFLLFICYKFIEFSNSKEVDEDRIKIFVFYNGDKELPEEVLTNNIYQPVHLGTRENDKYSNNPRILYDDILDNISYKNFTYSEYSGLYWIWKNLDLSKYDRIGISHYRRLTSMDDCKALSSTIAWRNSSILELNTSILNQFTLCHGQSLIRCLDDIFNDDINMHSYFDNNNIFFANTCGIMSTKKFNELCEFLFNCAYKIENYYHLDNTNSDTYRNSIENFLKNVSYTDCDSYQKRLLSFILERLTSYFVYNNTSYNIV